MESPQGEVYMIDMELGQKTLLDRIRDAYYPRNNVSEHRFSLEEISGIIQQIAAGVADIHKRGIIHRDLKPANSKTLLYLR